MATVLANLLEAHARAARQLRLKDTVDADGDGHPTRIGLAHHVRVFQAASGSTADTAVAALTDTFFNESVTEAIRTGRIHLSVPGQVEHRPRGGGPEGLVRLPRHQLLHARLCPAVPGRARPVPPVRAARPGEE